MDGKFYGFGLNIKGKRVGYLWEVYVNVFKVREVRALLGDSIFFRVYEFVF